MPIVKVNKSFTYRDASFEEGKHYDVRETPEGFIKHWFVDGKRGDVLDDGVTPKNAEVLPDPRFPDAVDDNKPKKKSKASDTDNSSGQDTPVPPSGPMPTASKHPRPYSKAELEQFR